MTCIGGLPPILRYLQESLYSRPSFFASGVGNRWLFRILHGAFGAPLMRSALVVSAEKPPLLSATGLGNPWLFSIQLPAIVGIENI